MRVWPRFVAAYPRQVASASQTTEPAAESPTRSRVDTAVLVLVSAVIAVAVAVVLAVLSGSEQIYANLGLPDPGVITLYGVTAVRVVTEIASAICIGALLLAAFLVPPQRSGLLSKEGYRSLRVAAWTAVVWCIGAILEVPLTAADAEGRPVSQLLDLHRLSDAVNAVEQAQTWLITVIIVGLLALVCFITLSWKWTAAWFFLALAGLLPVVLSGHSAAGGSHDLATNSLLYHLVAAAVWVGGLAALLGYAHRRGSHLVLAVTRFSKLALVCWLVMAASGVLNALIRLPLSEIFTTAYGYLVIAKIALLTLLGGIGYLQRQRAVKSITATGSRRPLLRLAAVEVLVMFATIGVAATLARTPPPAPTGQISTLELLIGYPLDGQPTFLKLLFDWRFDLIYGTAAVLGVVFYLVGVRRLRRRGDHWPISRTITWICGCVVVLLATSSGIGRYSPAMFSVHMGSHMMLNMLAPPLLALGGPVTLAMRALPVAGKTGAPGPREWLLAFVHSRLAKTLTHPVVALTLFVGSFYLLYFSGLFDAALNYHWAHLAMNAHFLLVGYLFYWPVIGIDPAPRKLPPLARLGMVFASMPFHAFFGVILMNMQTVIGGNFYRSLALPWLTDQLSDQRLGGGIAWAFGEIPLLVVMVALLLQWSKSDERIAKHADRRAEADGDADLVAYNAMLKQLSGGKTSLD